MSRVTKETAGGRAYLDLQNRARREKRTTQELFTLYVLESWLARLAASEHAGTFVLKGGMLLAVLGARRPTSDADLLARDLANDESVVLDRVLAVAGVHREDGVEYLPDTVAVQSIREDDLYTGVRVTMDSRVSAARVKLKLDIDFGDPVTPEPRFVAVSGPMLSAAGLSLPTARNPAPVSAIVSMLDLACQGGKDALTSKIEQEGAVDRGQRVGLASPASGCA